MSTSRVLGTILLVVGIVCLGFGLNSSRTVANHVVEAATGRFTKPTMWYLMGGIAMAVGGWALCVGGRHKP